MPGKLQAKEGGHVAQTLGTAETASQDRQPQRPVAVTAHGDSEINQKDLNVLDVLEQDSRGTR